MCFAYVSSFRVEYKRAYYINQRHYRQSKWDSEVRSRYCHLEIIFILRKKIYILPNLLPVTPLWSLSHLLPTDLERTDFESNHTSKNYKESKHRKKDTIGYQLFNNIYTNFFIKLFTNMSTAHNMRYAQLNIHGVSGVGSLRNPLAWNWNTAKSWNIVYIQFS